MKFRVVRTEKYYAWIEADNEEHLYDILSEMSNGESSWISDPDDTELEIEEAP
jgi:hypothetical protein